ncbi:hypothetical protein, partial [Shewanella algae]|uniref:hypothetical protein n=1 Tax=Shewanella algae TaxID=38313 RepID=UPI00313E096B
MSLDRRATGIAAPAGAGAATGTAERPCDGVAGALADVARKALGAAEAGFWATVVGSAGFGACIMPMTLGAFVGAGPG